MKVWWRDWYSPQHEGEIMLPAMGKTAESFFSNLPLAPEEIWKEESEKRIIYADRDTLDCIMEQWWAVLNGM